VTNYGGQDRGTRRWAVMPAGIRGVLEKIGRVTVHSTRSHQLKRTNGEACFGDAKKKGTRNVLKETSIWRGFSPEKYGSCNQKKRKKKTWKARRMRNTGRTGTPRNRRDTE